LLLLLLSQVVRAEQPLAASTIVVYNKAAPDSAELARFYAQQRGIALDHVVALDCSTDEEITREEFDTNIADPLREIFQKRGWWSAHDNQEQQTIVTATSIRFAAVIKGVPLKIKPHDGPYSGDKPGEGPVSGHNEASVDSELAVLALFTRQLSGPLRNPYFKSFKNVGEIETPLLLLVCRLDGPNTQTVRRMISDSIATEKRGLWGRAYVDGAHESAAGYRLGDEWLGAIPIALHKVGVPVNYENSPALFPEGYPMTDCALYYGWRSERASGPFSQAGFNFSRGAVAVHIHSYSGSTLRDPNANWVAPLLQHGAAATLGNVYEPYLQFTSHLDILNDRLLHGFTFAESAYSSIEVLSWMSVMVGDPLYRPYGAWLQLDAAGDSGKADSWKMYHDFAVQNFSSAPAQYRSLARQVASRARNCPMLEDLGLIEAADGNFAAAASLLGQAHSCYSTRDDILRVILEEADALNKLNKPKRGVDLLRTALRVSGNAPAAPLLKKKEEELRGVGVTPAPGSTPKPTPRVRVRF
jgi:uncharacterized protein (TIGR03790 family)